MKDLIFFQHQNEDVEYLYVDIHEQGKINVLCLGKVPEYQPLRAVQSDESEAPEVFLAKIFSQYANAKQRYILINDQRYTLLPKDLFNEENKETFLRSLTGDWNPQTTSVYCDSFDVEKAFLIYHIPNYLFPFLRSEHCVTACYHLETATRYISKKKSFIQRPNCVIVHTQGKRRASLRGVHKNSLLFLQNFEVESFDDIHYYTKYFMQEHFAKVPPPTLQLLIFTPKKSETEDFVREIMAEYPGILVHAYTEEDILRTYRIQFPINELDELFSLFLASICEL